MLLQQNKYTNVSGVFPNAIMIDASGAGLTDGSEFAALPLNDGWEPFSQAVMSYAGGTQLQNSPTGAVGVPNGVADAVGVSQMFEALQKSIGNGPGNYTLWANELDPSVTGDRIVLLAEQGLLIAVYPGIDDANWIGGNTAAQVAAEAAGEKFYRSSDAGGAVGDAAGPYIQLPAQPEPTFLKQYLGDGTDFSVTSSPAVSSLIRAVAVPYLTSDGVWRLIFNISYNVASGARTSCVGTMSGVVFKNVASFQQAISANAHAGAATIQRDFRVNPNTGEFQIQHQSDTTTRYTFSGDVELESKPTWADDITYQWGIRY